MLSEHYANAGSLTHNAGRQVAEVLERAVADMAGLIGAASDELVITSGATESNNLALFGTCLHPRQRRRKVVSVVSEHKAILDPLARLERLGWEVVYVPVEDNQAELPGGVDWERLHNAIDEQTALVTVMLANNEIGTLQPFHDQCS